MTSLLRMLEDRGKLVDGFLLQMLELDASKELYKIALHQMVAGGKRIRPAMTILSCEAVDGKLADAVPAAAGIELIHNYTLIYDDIIDRADLRRGFPTVRAMYGDVMAFLAGMHYREAISESARRCTKSKRIDRLFSWTIKRIIEGERLDVLFEQAGRNSAYIKKMRFKHVTESDYQRMIEAKTAVLFQAACEAGSIIGGGEPAETEALSKYGWNCGIAFQIQDDILDVIGKTEKLGKTVGKDFREHKLGNIILLYTLDQLSKPQKDKVLQTLRAEKMSDRDIHELLDITLSTTAVNKAQEKTEEFIQRAKLSLDVLSPSRAKDVLLRLTDFIIQRNF